MGDVIKLACSSLVTETHLSNLSMVQAQAEGIDRYLGSSNGLMEFSSKAESGRARGQDTEGLSCEGARRWGGARGLG